jgi:hypothetical protein
MLLKRDINEVNVLQGLYHHYRCEFESRSCEVYSLQHYVMKFVSDLQ